jgi:diguanylate cyclase (GGDEF)-like protein
VPRIDSSQSAIIDDLTVALRQCRSAVDACQAAVQVLGQHTGALVAVLLHVNDRLRCVAAGGSWQVFSSVPLGRGVVGRVYASGEPVTILSVADDPDYIALGTDAVTEICVPVTDRTGQPVGVLNNEWTRQHPIDGWQKTLAEVGRLLGARVDELGGPPPETRSEQLLRHSLALTAAKTEKELVVRVCQAAREVTGLAAAVLLRDDPISGPIIAASSPEPRDRPLVARLADAPPSHLRALLDRTVRHGASYSLGDPRMLDAHGLETLTGAGVRTMISVPLGPDAMFGALVTLDDEASVPPPATVNLLELLATQAATCMQQLDTVRQLHLQANSDPLTGLRHGGPFSRRLADATPGRTALLAIDIDEFKKVNDVHGHAAGDRVLIEVANALQQELRLGDELFRIGGDEFVAVVDVPSEAEALRVAGRLVVAARSTGRTISVGVAVQHAEELAQSALHRADQALYAVKRAGRDNVRLAP